MNPSLEQQLADARERIEENNEAILKCKRNLVELEKDPQLTRGMKDMFIQEFQEHLSRIREIKSNNIQIYYELYRRLGEIVMSHKNNAVSIGVLSVDINGQIKPL